MAWHAYSSSPLTFLTAGPAACLIEWVLSPLFFYLKVDRGVTEHCRHYLCFRKWSMSRNHPDIMIPDHCHKPSELYNKCYKHRHLKDFPSFRDYVQKGSKSHSTSYVMGSASSFLRSSGKRWKKPVTHICLEYKSIMCLQCVKWCKRATSMIHISTKKS